MAMRTSDTAVDDDGGGIHADAATWAVHFPGNLRWSNAMQIVKGHGALWRGRDGRDRSASRSGSRRAPAKPISTASGCEEWSREADRVAQIGDEADAAGQRHITAGNQYMRAGNYYYSAERFIPPGERRWRCIARRCAATRARWRGCIPTSSASRCPTRTRACPPGSSRAAAPARGRPWCCSTAWTTPRR